MGVFGLRVEGNTLVKQVAMAQLEVLFLGTGKADGPPSLCMWRQDLRAHIAATRIYSGCALPK